MPRYGTSPVSSSHSNTPYLDAREWKRKGDVSQWNDLDQLFSTGGSRPKSGLQSCLDWVVHLWAVSEIQRVVYFCMADTWQEKINVDPETPTLENHWSRQTCANVTVRSVCVACCTPRRRFLWRRGRTWWPQEPSRSRCQQLTSWWSCAIPEPGQSLWSSASSSRCHRFQSFQVIKLKWQEQVMGYFRKLTIFFNQSNKKNCFL